jgi:adenylate cyclase
VIKPWRRRMRGVDRVPDEAAKAGRILTLGRMPVGKLALQYAGALACAHLLAVADAAAIVIPLNGRVAPAPHAYFGPKNVTIVVVLVLLGSVAVAAGGIMNLASTLRWFVQEQVPNARQRRASTRLVSRQSLLLAATWAVSGVILVALNISEGLAIAVPTFLGVIFGGIAAASISLLLTERSLRPILLAAAQESEGSEGVVTAPGVFARLMSLWLLSSALPCAVILTLIFVRSHGWVIQRTASIELPVFVTSLAAVLLGLPVMILTSRSISQPIGEVVDAMAEVERGKIDTFVGIYERSEIGRLQIGFNRMVSGLAERDRLRDLFGRHVGADVARRALKEGASLSGEVREAAVLFIDLVGSTTLAASRSPQEVADILNQFFEIVFSAVDQRRGQINKFQGDAALAVFGAPLPTPGSPSAALATARTLRSELRRLPIVDFGIGVSAGPVFAGNIGAENRYEYTVIGDVVNEAARLADLAKVVEARVVCAAVALERADANERRHWASHGETVLRGRADSTKLWIPADD